VEILRINVCRAFLGGGIVAAALALSCTTQGPFVQVLTTNDTTDDMTVGGCAPDVRVKSNQSVVVEAISRTCIVFGPSSTKLGVVNVRGHYNGCLSVPEPGESATRSIQISAATRDVSHEACATLVRQQSFSRTPD
jgi:peptide deformylase